MLVGNYEKNICKINGSYYLFYLFYRHNINYYKLIRKRLVKLMFSSKTYNDRREVLAKNLNNGKILLMGNSQVPMNYPSNWLRFRQDSNFLYYCGLDYPDLNLVIDTSSGESTLFGNDLTIQDIVWEGERTSIANMAEVSGIQSVLPSNQLSSFLLGSNETIHYLPLYRQDQQVFLESILNNNKIESSKSLIINVISQRSIKTEDELSEIESAIEVTMDMHKLAMRQTSDGILEQTIAGKIEGYALQNGRELAYPVIFTTRGEILHNHNHNNIMCSGQLALNDSGAESPMHYASDITRTFPVSGRFTDLQKEIYNIVYNMQEAAFAYCKPGNSYRQAHLTASKIAVEGLINMGIMKGNADDAVKEGAHALFFPHGLGHMLGLDVHDMEGLGEDLVGYNEESNRSNQFGLAYLRLAKELVEGFVLTVEPGIYFIPHLINQWKAENKSSAFINYDSLNKFVDFGGIRIEDNVVITSDGYRILGPHIPRTINEIEDVMA